MNASEFILIYLFGPPLIYVAFTLSVTVLDLVLVSMWRGAKSMGSRHRAAPLQQKNFTRATAGAFALVACAVLAAYGFPVVGPKLTAGIAAFAALYLVVGVASQNSSVDFMSVFWWSALAIGCAALLIYVRVS
jgi:hypothetical protein